MARSPRRLRKVYWDSCVWIALIQNEVVKLKDGTIENRGALCRAVIDAAVRGGSERTDIFTSALALVEVSKPPSAGVLAGPDKLKDFFENDYIVVVALDRRTGEVGRDFMQRGFSGLKPADATHVASAAMANVDEMHTFDDDLLGLNGIITRADGRILRICKPSMGGEPLPLLESPAPPSRSDDTEADQVG